MYICFKYSYQISIIYIELCKEKLIRAAINSNSNKGTKRKTTKDRNKN